MRRFTALYLALDATTRTLAKQQALEAYFRAAPAADVAWAAFFLTGRKLKRLVRTRDLRDAALKAASIPEWLFDASYEAAGDIAETIALLLPPGPGDDDRSLAVWVEDEIAPLAGLPPDAVLERLALAWSVLDRDSRFVHLKLITGAFRVGVAKQLVERALAAAFDVPIADVAQRLVGDWTPSTAFVEMLRGNTLVATPVRHRPYPFFLAHALEAEPSTLGGIDAWQVEWKWDGIRAQLVVRDGSAALWSRGEALVSEAFPEIVDAAHSVPNGTVLDGEVLVWLAEDAFPAAFASLQTRINRKRPGPKLLRDVPVALCVYDLLEVDGQDVRERPLHARRARLEELVPRLGSAFRLSPLATLASWDEAAAARRESRARRAEGLMLKRRDSPYGIGRVRGPWWKWKVDPHTVDAVLVYAQSGHGRRASLFTDYTFAVWDGDALVPFAKAYSGLSNEEIRRVDAWIRAHTLERFGPVRRVEPALVFELAFEGLQVSARHKSGVAVRFPRILRWRTDKIARDADTLDGLRARAAGVLPDDGKHV
jgi:DNA ligase-1